MPTKGYLVAEHGTDSRYSYGENGEGCRCQPCREAHAEVCKRWKWERTYGDDGPMGPKVRKKILASLKVTGNVKATAEAVGVTYQAIYRAAKSVPGFGELVAERVEPRG